jgi:short-subunit dehydrogenase
MELHGKLALVTGASSGIGEATALALAAKGMHVILVARTPEPLESVVASIRRAGGRADAIPADVGSIHDVRAMADQVLERWGVPDVIINNAGAGRFLFLDETDPEEAVAMMAVPYFAAFYVTRAFIEGMLERGSGTILQINTPAATIPWPGAVGYASSRYALRGFTDALRQDLRGTGIRVSSLTPAKVSSPYFDRHPGAEDRIPGIEKLIGTITPDQAAHVVIRTLEKGRRDVHTPWRWAAVEPFARAFPAPMSWLTWRTGTRHPAAMAASRPWMSTSKTRR